MWEKNEGAGDVGKLLNYKVNITLSEIEGGILSKSIPDYHAISGSFIRASKNWSALTGVTGLPQTCCL